MEFQLDDGFSEVIAVPEIAWYGWEVSLVQGPDAGDWRFSASHGRGAVGRVVLFDIPQEVGVTYDLILCEARKALRAVKIRGWRRAEIRLGPDLATLMDRRKRVKE